MIDREKREWMEKIGIREFKRPMKYHFGPNQLFSEEYISATPLEVLKERVTERKLNWESFVNREADGKPTKDQVFV